MAAQDVLRVVDRIHNILTDSTKQKVVKNAPSLIGGWEDWLQVELAIAVAEHMTTNVSREQYVYQNNALKNDLKIYVGDNNNIKYYLSVELKVESVGQAKNFPETIFKTDITKVENLFKNDICWACGIMVLVNKENIEFFDENFVNAKGQHSMGRLPKTGGFGSPVIYWWDLEVNTASGKPFATVTSPEVFFNWAVKDKSKAVFDIRD